MKLRDYDVIVVNTSSGKDSQTLLDLICTKADQENVIDRVMCAHADLGRIEWPGAAELAEKQAGLYGVPFWKMARPKGDMIQYAVSRGKWPSPKQRWCTSDFKRDQINKLHTKLSKDLGSQDLRILNCMGMRAEESPAPEHCATHDYCDPNVFMHNAWQWCMEEDFDQHNHKHVELWNAAWRKARKASFDPDAFNDEVEFKVWIEVERIDHAEDEYTNDQEPETLGSFNTAAEARAFVRKIQNAEAMRCMGQPERDP